MGCAESKYIFDFDQKYDKYNNYNNYRDILRYEGEFKRGRPSGYGKLYRERTVIDNLSFLSLPMPTPLQNNRLEPIICQLKTLKDECGINREKIGYIIDALQDLCVCDRNERRIEYKPELKQEKGILENPEPKTLVELIQHVEREYEHYKKRIEKNKYLM
jgi:hypothetical protein